MIVSFLARSRSHAIGHFLPFTTGGFLAAHVDTWSHVRESERKIIEAILVTKVIERIFAQLGLQVRAPSSTPVRGYTKLAD